jgi:hypothetical protein
MMRSDDIPIAALREAAQNAELIAAVENLYREVGAEIAARAPTCWNRGDCCRFGAYGHRLYVTAIEVAYYLHHDHATPPAAGGGLPVLPSAGADTCPHAFDGRCHARDARPLGCRIFYCDPAARDWQGPLTETYLARLRELHTRFDVPCFYADWMQVMHALER